VRVPQEIRIYEATWSGTLLLLLQTYKLRTKMEAAKVSTEALRNQIAATEKQLQELKIQLARLESKDKADNQPAQPDDDERPQKLMQGDIPKWPLTQEEYSRYGRQMIVSSIGIQG
jgi:adenylyltransferase/sulfurtransferase